MTAQTMIRSRCVDCGNAIELDVAAYPAKLAALAAKTCGGWVCPACSDRLEADEQDDRNRAAAERAVADHRTAIRRSKVPPLPAAFSMPDTAAGVAAMEWAQRRTLTLTLHGPVGTGKTTLARWAFRQRLAPVVTLDLVRGLPGAWRSMAGYMAQLGAGFGTPEKDDAVWLAQGGIVLGLDDLDKTTPSEFAASAVYALVNGAYETRSPLIVTMNAHPAQLATKWPGQWGDSIVSRLSEGVVVEVGGDDLRMNGGRRG